MKKLAAIGALGLLASCLYAQGLSTGGQTKDDWEEINFEFNSSILSDGYPSLLRLADLLAQHKDYHVKVTGHTDYVGSAAYNDKLAQRRADAVKAFLVKYGASADQITTAGDGKRNPEVENRTKEGRFMNRRVVLAVTDGTGKLIKEGGIGDVVQTLLDMAKKQEECCAQILKRLDKLDDILAALKALQGDNDRLKGELADLRNAHNALKDQVANLPKPLNEQQTQSIAHTEAMGAVDEAQKRNKKFTMLGMNIGPTFGPGRTGDFTFRATRPVLLAVRRRRAQRGTGPGRVHVLPGPQGRPVRHRSGAPVGQGAGRQFRQLQVPGLQPVSVRAAAWDRAPSCWTTCSTAAAWVRSSPAGSRTTPS